MHTWFSTCLFCVYMSPCKDVCSVHQLILMHLYLRTHLHIYIYTSYKLYIYIILHILLAESPHHSTCEATHPSVGHGVDGAAWFPSSISRGTLKKNLLRAFVPLVVAHSLCQYIFEAATTCALKFQLQVGFN